MTNDLLLLYTGYIDLLGAEGTAIMVMSWIQILLPFLIVAGLWRIFAKASQPGWAAVIPIYAEMTLCKIAGRAWWWTLLFVAPFLFGIARLLLDAPLDGEVDLLHLIIGSASWVVQLVVFATLVERFGKGTGYYLGVVFFPYVFLPMLGFGSATYRAPFKRAT